MFMNLDRYAISWSICTFPDTKAISVKIRIQEAFTQDLADKSSNTFKTRAADIERKVSYLVTVA